MTDLTLWMPYLEIRRPQQGLKHRTVPCRVASTGQIGRLVRVAPDAGIVRFTDTDYLGTRVPFADLEVRMTDVSG